MTDLGTCWECETELLALHHDAEWDPHPEEYPRVDGWGYCPNCGRPRELRTEVSRE